jgi:hypothetical protein
MKQEETDCLKTQFVEGKHFYFNKDGLMVLTAQFHLEKGFCCGMGCLHCPYQFINVPATKTPKEAYQDPD